MRHGFTPITAAVIVVFIGLAIFAAYSVININGYNEQVVYRIFFVGAYLVEPVSVENAGW